MFFIVGKLFGRMIGRTLIAKEEYRDRTGATVGGDDGSDIAQANFAADIRKTFANGVL